MQVADKKYYKEVLVKDLATLETTLKQKNTVLLIYANWCLHCNLFKPTWNKVAQTVRQSKILNQQVQLLGIESEVFKVLSDRNPKLYKYISTTRTSKDIYFPKVMVFQKDKQTPYEYDGDKSETTMINYINKKFSINTISKSEKSKVTKETKPISLNGNNKRSIDKVRSKLRKEIDDVTAQSLPNLIDRMISKYLGL
jgi:thiol-disulfide isomerase/thioredoxin